jgi:hypothetical protein
MDRAARKASRYLKNLEKPLPSAGDPRNGICPSTRMWEPVYRINALMARHDRFVYDLRADCHVLYGIVVPYRSPGDGAVITDLSRALALAFSQDGILEVWRALEHQRTCFASCRIFTDLEQAFRFARVEGQGSVNNLNRGMVIDVPPTYVRSRRSLNDHVLTPRKAFGLR